MRQPAPRNWTNENPTAPITADTTPAAAVDLLVMADGYPVDVATTPYCGVGRLFNGSLGTAQQQRYLAFMVAPGALHARAAFTRPRTGGGTDPGHDTLSWTGTGGSTAPNIVNTPDPMTAVDPTVDGLTWTYAYGYSVSPLTTGVLVDDTPAQIEDRQYTLAQHAYPYVETAYFMHTGSLAIWISQQVPNLETL